MSSLTNFAVSIYVARDARGRAVRRLQPRLRDLLVRAQRVTRPGHRPADGQVQRHGSPTWRRAVASCSGTATAVGLVAGACVLAAAELLMARPGRLPRARADAARTDVAGQLAILRSSRSGAAARRSSTTRSGWWRCCPRWCSCGSPVTRTCSGSSSRGVRRRGSEPRSVHCRPGWCPGFGSGGWVSRHRDLGPRYLLEGILRSGSTQLRNYGVGLLLGLAAVGYVQAANTLMGPFMVVFFGMGLVALPEAARVLRRSPRHMILFCALVGGGMAVLGLIWGVLLLVALPRGLGDGVLGPIGCRPTRWCCRSPCPWWAHAPGGATGACTLWGPRGAACGWRSSRRSSISAVVWWGLLPEEQSGRCAAPPLRRGLSRCLVVAAARGTAEGRPYISAVPVPVPRGHAPSHGR